MRIKYEGSNTVLSIPLNDINERKITQLFKNKHIKTYGFYYEKKNIILDSIEAEASYDQSINFNLKLNKLINSSLASKLYNKKIIKNINSGSFKNKSHFQGYVLFSDFNTTLVIEKNWKINKKTNGIFEINKIGKKKKKKILE